MIILNKQVAQFLVDHVANGEVAFTSPYIVNVLPDDVNQASLSLKSTCKFCDNCSVGSFESLIQEAL